MYKETKVYSSVGGRAVLPCSGAKFSRSCAEVNWAKLWMSIVPEPVVCSGRVVTPSKRSSEPRLGADCSLHIDNLEKEDGGTYVCEHSAGNRTISLQLLSISVEPSTALAVSHRVSLHCYLSAFTGLVLCNHSGVKLTWVTERGTELQGDRYSISYKSACHTVLSVVLRATDHQRKWSCQLTEHQEVKTTVSHVTALADAVEEMFASEGQTLMLPCTDPASLSAGEKLQWSLSETPLFSLTTDGQVTALVKGSTQGLRMNPDASLSIHGMTEKLSGRYCCSKLNNSDRISVHRMIVVHLLTCTVYDNIGMKADYQRRCHCNETRGQQEDQCDNHSPTASVPTVLFIVSDSCMFLNDPKYADEEDLNSKLESFKNKYMEFDLNDQGEIDMMGLKRMLEKLGVAKTHLELKKMISEVVGGASRDTIGYSDFLNMMLGKRNAILRIQPRVNVKAPHGNTDRLEKI
ncbi:hypothetical protein Z043_116610 [Scleropages formosus]|uniref:Ig-like domain-containing protein n=1 Tax=Scleropages formosus TaxID=113540 RepID=A0A0P7UBH3_SCLFO|nr:hypothetical protein Z043_116610 [Scleropages formosus]